MRKVNLKRRARFRRSLIDGERSGGHTSSFAQVCEEQRIRVENRLSEAGARVRRARAENEEINVEEFAIGFEGAWPAHDMTATLDLVVKK